MAQHSQKRLRILYRRLFFRIKIDEMSTNPLVSIITPSYNKGEFIEETIQSVLNQTYQNIEYIIIDGKSIDNTVQILMNYPHLKWVSEPDSGQTDAINKGLNRAKGEILAYLNADDTYLPDTIETIVNVFRTQPKTCLIYGDIIHTDKNSNVINIHKTGNIDLERFISHRFYLPQPTVFFRQDVLANTGMFDDSLHLAMDYDYWLRTFPYYPSQYINKPLATARIYNNAKSTARNYDYIEERVQVLDKFFSLAKNETTFKKIEIKAYAFAHFLGANDYLRVKIWDKGWYHLKMSFSLYPLIITSGDFYKTTAGTILKLMGILRGCHIPD